MKSAKLFLAAMYLHLALSVAVPLAILFAGEWTAFGEGLFAFYLFFIGVSQLLGWVAVAMAARAGGKGETDRVFRAWRLLKLGSVPFFVLNFLYSVAVWFLIVAASRGIFLIFVPIPIAITCFFILETGCVGCVAVKALRRQPPPVPGKLHYFLQLLPVADVVSTLLLLHRQKQRMIPQSRFTA